MLTEIAQLKTPLPAFVYEIAVEVGEPFIEDAARLLWHRKGEALFPVVVGQFDLWARACCCCGEDESDVRGEMRDEVRGCLAKSAALMVVVSPLLNDDWSDPLSAEEVLFGVRAKRRRWRLRPLQTVWIC